LDMRSIEHRFDPSPTPEVQVSTMTMRHVPAIRSIPAPRVQPMSRPALRLTRRGRVVVVVLVSLALVVAVLAGVLLGGGSAAAGEHATPVPVLAARHHVVLPGETLWQIAAVADPAADPGDTVVRITELNHLGSARLPVGLDLELPPSA